MHVALIDHVMNWYNYFQPAAAADFVAQKRFPRAVHMRCSTLQNHGPSSPGALNLSLHLRIVPREALAHAAQ
jgi:hypothetical protein